MPIGDISIQPQPGPIPLAQAWGALTTQSSFSNVTSFQPQPPYQTGTDTPGCYFDIPNLVTLSPNGTYQIPYEKGYLVTGAVVNSAVVQFQVGTIGSWVTVKTLNANDAWNYRSDYGDIRILNGAAGTTVITLYPVRKR